MKKPKPLKTVLQPQDYQAIALWGSQLHSHSYYIVQQQELACDMGAPIDSIYYDERKGLWHTVRGLSADHPFREAYKARLSGMLLAVTAKQKSVG